MKNLAMLLLAGLLLLPLTIACTGGNSQLIFRISAPTNAHAELWNGAGTYPEEICYDDIFPITYGGALPHNDNGSNTVLRLSAATNAHADSTGAYPVAVYYGDLVCSYADTSMAEDCDTIGGEECVATISSATNAHVSSSCSGAGSYPIKVCCISAAAMNNPPDAIIDTPVADPSVTVGGPVDFTGTGVDSDGVIVAYSWTCVAAVGVCPAAFPLNVEDPGNVVFGTIGTYTITFNVQDDDGDWDPTPDTRSVTVLAPGSDPYMKIILFSADPLGFPADVTPDFTKLDVRVKNYGGAVNNARIMVEVRDPTTNEPLSVPVSASVVVGIASGGESVQDFESLDISALPPGAYKLAAEVFNLDAASPELQDSKALYFTIGKPVPVPELDLLLLPLIAFSVLTVLFLAGKRKA